MRKYIVWRALGLLALLRVDFTNKTIAAIIIKTIEVKITIFEDLLGHENH